MDIVETKQHRFLAMEIYGAKPFSVLRRHKHKDAEADDVYWPENSPVSLRESDTYLPLRLAPTHGQGLAIVARVDKLKGREEYVLLNGETEELYEVHQLAEGRIAELLARAPKPVAASAPPRRSHKRKASV